MWNIKCALHFLWKWKINLLDGKFSHTVKSYNFISKCFILFKMKLSFLEGIQTYIKLFANFCLCEGLNKKLFLQFKLLSFFILQNPVQNSGDNSLLGDFPAQCQCHSHLLEAISWCTAVQSLNATTAIKHFLVLQFWRSTIKYIFWPLFVPTSHF